MINVNELSITNVWQEYWLEKSIDIKFELPTGRYELHLSQNREGIYFPNEIYHLKNDQDCPYCDGNEAGCIGLKIHKKELFYRLIEFPSIRLEWLYLPHEPFNSPE